MMSWYMIFIVAVIFVPVSFLLTAIPYLIRRTESFGVSVTEEVHALPVNRMLRKQYAWITGVCCGLITLSIAILHQFLDEKAWSVALIVHIFGIIALSFIIYLRFHFSTKRLKREQNWSSAALAPTTVVDTGFFKRKLVYSPAWFAPQVVIVLISFLIGIFWYDRFPDQIIMQYDLQGNPTNVIEKTRLSVLWPAIIQCFLISVFILCYYIILRSKQQIDASDPEGSVQRNVLFRRRWSAFILLLGFLMNGLFLFIQISMIVQFSPSLTLGVTLGLVAVAIVASLVLSITTGQGGSRIKATGHAAPSGKSNTDQDQYWKLGIFYFNRHDPALFVEKRFGIGWTVNFARPIGWIILVSILVVAFGMSFVFN